MKLTSTQKIRRREAQSCGSLASLYLRKALEAHQNFELAQRAGVMGFITERWEELAWIYERKAVVYAQKAWHLALLAAAGPELVAPPRLPALEGKGPANKIGGRGRSVGNGRARRSRAG